MFLGNIVSERSIIVSDLFNVISDIRNIDDRVPTLIIGWDFSKRIFSDTKLSILDKKINKNISWTFTKKEKRIDYEKDLESFIKYCLNSINNRINYQYINILTADYKIIKNLIKKVTSTEISYIYVCKNAFIYIYSNGNVIGIDFNSIDYLYIDRKKIYKILYGRGNKIFFNNSFLPSGINENIENRQRIIPYLYEIQNGKQL